MVSINHWAKIWTIPNVVSSDHCSLIIESSDLATWERSGASGNRTQTRSTSSIRIDTAPIFLKVQNALPDTILSWRLCRISEERMTFLQYRPGDSFEKHTDGRYRPNEDEQSIFTIILYLNDSFSGGETVFTNLRRHIAPETGTAQIFPHRIYHESLAISNGTKFAIQSFIMYQRNHK